MQINTATVRLAIVLTTLEVITACAAVGPTFTDANWVSMNPSFGAGIPGTDRKVLAAVADASGNLYTGGEFIVAGNVVANRIAKWNGTNWSALGSGMNGTVRALAVAGSDLYAAGDFTTAGGVSASYIAKWNGSSWSALGSGIGGPRPAPPDPNAYDPNVYFRASVLALAVSGPDLYVGGGFTTAGGMSATNIAKWNGSSWSALGSGLRGEYPDSTAVQALAVSGSDLYAGGRFTTAGGVSATNIAKWNGGSWSALGSGTDDGGAVQALAVSGTNLYAGGRFTTAGGNPANFIAKWDGSTRSALGSGMATGGHVNPPDVTALVVSGGDLYAGGWFATAGGVNTGMIAKWNGSNWSALGSGLGEPDFGGPNVNALAVSGSNLYAGGSFTTPSGVSANHIAKWNGSSWSGLGSTGASASVGALAVSGSDLYAGGEFTTMGVVSATNIAKWDGSTWSALGSGMNGSVDALAVSGSDLYAGGGFTTAGGLSATNIARWNGSTWSELGSGMNGSVDALAVSGTDLYAGGSFTTAGGVSATNIAKWNGSTWSALGSGMNGPVLALAVSGSDLYAGGYFTTAGGMSATSMAKWNGSSWSPLSSGIDVTVSALAVSGSDLYAGGYFRMAPGNYYFIAKWNGSSWSPLGSGVGLGTYGPTVAAVAVRGGDLYVGGSFTTAGGVPANYIAKWDGISWSALGSGLNGSDYTSVSALALMGRNLYAGGSFSTAGGKISPYVARAYLVLPPTLSLLRTGGSVTLSWQSFFGEFVLQQNPNMTNAQGWSNSIYPLTTNGAIKSATIPITPGNQFFRLMGN